MGDIRTGEINELDHFRRNMTDEEFERFIRPVEPSSLSPHNVFALEKTGRAKIGRNDPCFCGSGKKFKRCCMELPQPVEQKAPSVIVAPW